METCGPGVNILFLKPKLFLKSILVVIMKGKNEHNYCDMESVVDIYVLIRREDRVRMTSEALKRNMKNNVSSAIFCQ